MARRAKIKRIRPRQFYRLAIEPTDSRDSLSTESRSKQWLTMRSAIAENVVRP
jgi:hypothetical protein